MTLYETLGRRVRLAGICALALVMASTAGCERSDAAAAEDAARAQALLDARRYAEARLAINDAIAERDDEPQFHILRGRIEMAAGSLTGAYDAYSNAMSLDPANREALQAVSQLGLQTGHLQDSLEATDAILSLAPDDTGALLMRGLHSVIRSRFDEADGYADRILALDPANEGGVILKARIAVRRNAPQKALEILTAYGTSRPNTVGILRTRLEIYRFLRDAKGMRDQFALLRSLAPDNPALRLDEANFAFKDGRPGDGEALLAALLSNSKLPAEQIPAILALWTEYRPAGPGDGSLDAIAATGTRAARLAVAEYLVERGRIAVARRLLDGLDSADRAGADAAIAGREGRWAEALRAAGAILDQDDTHCLALTVRAEGLLRRGDAPGALRSAQLAASQCPGQISAWTIAAEAYARRNDTDNARQMWRQGVKNNPQNSVIYGRYVNWLLAGGHGREAIAAARRLTRAAPALLSGWRLYETVCNRLADACAADARAGLAEAATAYGIDLLPGEAPPNGLFGRIVNR